MGQKFAISFCDYGLPFALYQNNRVLQKEFLDYSDNSTLRLLYENIDLTIFFVTHILDFDKVYDTDK